VNGRRIVPDAPANAKHRVFLFGACNATSLFASDNHTKGNYLQKLLNFKFPSIFEVIECGVNGNETKNLLKWILSTHFEDSDMILTFSLWDGPPKIYEKIINPTKKFDECCKGKYCFLDHPAHTTHHGNEIYANFIFETLQEKFSALAAQASSMPTTTVLQPALPQTYAVVENFKRQNPSFETYLQNLRVRKNCQMREGLKIGSIVMNCNPFTLGHRYLIEEARKQVDHLYIFVVEADKSIFKFVDRIKLVQEGTSDFANVTVLPSGSGIISTLTFPEYFEKEEKPEVPVTPTLDLELFGMGIAPELGINYRFAGEEPLDLVTRQYNRTMEQELPKYGINFVVIPRKETDGGVISASTVRKLLSQKNFSELAKFVPPSTLRYLESNFEFSASALSKDSGRVLPQIVPQPKIQAAPVPEQQTSPAIPSIYNPNQLGTREWWRTLRGKPEFEATKRALFPRMTIRERMWVRKFWAE
jgi:[citrate (pro-3S)-lyase] ligase